MYFDKLDSFIKSYFEILSGGKIPEFIEEYIETPEMQRISKISMGCGTDYTHIFNHRFFYTNLDHSVGVALIIWNFTHSKTQTLAGLFHDIATPVFKHCIDFMNGDYEKQESTEELTASMIKNSKEIMALLERDNIKIDEVNDYKIYPIADNDTPKLSADRFEYNFSNGFAYENRWTLDEIKKVYNDVIVLKNEENVIELGFEHLEIAELYVSIIRKIWPRWISKEVKLTMQFLADIVKKLYEAGFVTKADLYELSEAEIIEKIRNCKLTSKVYKVFENLTKVYESDTLVDDKYCVNIKAKRRYIIPLVKEGEKVVRINEVSEKAKELIDSYLKLKTKDYIWAEIEKI
jgi:hypothetical protein